MEKDPKKGYSPIKGKRYKKGVKGIKRGGRYKKGVKDQKGVKIGKWD